MGRGSSGEPGGAGEGRGRDCGDDRSTGAECLCLHVGWGGSADAVHLHCSGKRAGAGGDDGWEDRDCSGFGGGGRVALGGWVLGFFGGVLGMGVSGFDHDLF